MKVVNIKIYNMVKEKELLTLDINQNSITFLTGYNGTCKTSILQAIHKTICEFSDSKFPISRKKWGLELSFDDKSKIMNICFPPNKEGLSDHEFFEKYMKEIKGDNLKNFFDTYKTVQDKEGSMNIALESYYSSNMKYFINTDKRTESDESHTLMTQNLIEHYKINNDQNIVKSILFNDEMVSLSFNNEFKDKKSLEKLDVFSQKNNIDKTLFFQIELYKNNSTNSSFNKELYTTLKKYIKKDSIHKFDEEINNSLTSNNDQEFFIEKINSFFKKTNREIKFNTFDNFYYERNHEMIKWYDFSKGEKFLLVQMLLAYNFRNDNCIFLFDEPDSYLHIEWQQMLLTGLKEVSPNSTFIIASHSPSLISKETKIKFVNLNKYIV